MTDEPLPECFYTIPIPDFPTVIDSTTRSYLAACDRQFFWKSLMHLRKPGGNIHQHFGACLATGFEHTRKSFYAEGRSPEIAVQDGIMSAVIAWGDDGDILLPANPRASGHRKNMDALVDALHSYFTYYPLATDSLVPYMLDGKPVIEMSFALPIPNTAHPVTGEPIIYAGRFDMLGRHTDTDLIFPVDEKHSTQLGDGWRTQWRLRGQLTGYCYACREYGIKAEGAIIRGIGVLTSDITFSGDIIELRPEWQIDQWLYQLQRDVRYAADRWLEYRGLVLSGDAQPLRAWDQALDSACSAYGGCDCLDLCDSHNPWMWTNNYDTVVWDPLRERT